MEKLHMHTNTRTYTHAHTHIHIYYQNGNKQCLKLLRNTTICIMHNDKDHLFWSRRAKKSVHYDQPRTDSLMLRTVIQPGKL